MHMKTRLYQDVEREVDLNYTSYIILWIFAKLFLFFRNVFLEIVCRVHHHATLSDNETSITIFLLRRNHVMQRSVLITEY